MKRAGLIVASLALLASLPRRAHAEACDAANDIPVADPPALGLRDADLDAPRSPCVEERLDVAIVGDAIIDLPSFYGTIDGAARFELRHPFGRVELSGSAYVPSYWFQQNASLKATELRAGPITLGAMLPFHLPGSSSQSLGARLVLPGTELGRGGDRGALSLGLFAARRLTPSLTALGSFAGLAVATTAADGTIDVRFSHALDASIAWSPTRALTLQLGAGVPGSGLRVLAGLALDAGRAGRFDLAAAYAPRDADARPWLGFRLGWSFPL
jgi:hypothetical protein